MNVLIIGATGATGQQILPLLIAAGHRITVLVRNPAQLPTSANLAKVVTGDARDPAAVDEAVEGQHAVISVFGPRSLAKSDLQEVLMKNLVASMGRHGVKRIINLSAWGAGETAPHIKFVFALFRATLLKAVFDDKERGQKILTDSSLDFTNVHPGQLLDGPARGGVKLSIDGKGIKPQVTRADLARWMVDQLTSTEWVRKNPIIGY